MLTINGIDELKAQVGQELGVSDWHEVTQARIDAFADGDRRPPVHPRRPRARKQTPFGATIAHGLYTLGLGPKFSYAMFSVDGIAFGLNYGYEKVRFPAPRAGGLEAAHARDADEVDDIAGGVQFTITQTFEIEGGEKPVCVAESLSRVVRGLSRAWLSLCGGSSAVRLGGCVAWLLAGEERVSPLARAPLGRRFGRILRPLKSPKSPLTLPTQSGDRPGVLSGPRPRARGAAVEHAVGARLADARAVAPARAGRRQHVGPPVAAGAPLHAHPVAAPGRRDRARQAGRPARGGRAGAPGRRAAGAGSPGRPPSVAAVAGGAAGLTFFGFDVIDVK